MTLVDLLALALAARAVLDVWFEEDSILAEWRARTQLWQSWFWRTLFNCRFCMSYWVPAGVLVPFVASVFLPDPWAVVAKLPIYGLAATALVWLFDWAVKNQPRTVVIRTDGVELRHTAEVPAPPAESLGASTEPAVYDERWIPIGRALLSREIAYEGSRVLLAWPDFVGTALFQNGRWWTEVGLPDGEAELQEVMEDNPPTHWKPLTPP